MQLPVIPIENDYLASLLILIVTGIVILISRFFLNTTINRITKRKKQLGTIIKKELRVPLYSIILALGLYLVTTRLTILESYHTAIDGIAFVAITFLIAILLAKLINITLGTWMKMHRGVDNTPQLLNKLVIIIIFIIAILMILGYYDIDITPLIATLGLATLAIGLALQSTLANFFAGLHILSDRPFDVGDYIELDETTGGTVTDIGWRSTRIRTLAENLLVIPNSILAESNITNFSQPQQKMLLFVPCGVAYESNLRRVQQITLDVARHIQKTCEGAVKDFEPIIRFREFDESNINLLVILAVSEPLKRFYVRTELIIELKERYDKEGIEISWPIRKIYNIPPNQKRGLDEEA